MGDVDDIPEGERNLLFVAFEHLHKIRDIQRSLKSDGARRSLHNVLLALAMTSYADDLLSKARRKKK